jgi:hypothetical protein
MKTFSSHSSAVPRSCPERSRTGPSLSWLCKKAKSRLAQGNNDFADFSLCLCVFVVKNFLEGHE